MYTTIKKEDVTKYNGYKLCYIDEINQTYWDYTPEAKAYRETEEWKEQDRLRDEKFHREGCMSSDDPEFGYWANPVLRKGSESQDYPNPEYIPGEQEYYAYFTPIDMDKQWGDDWDDAPYEYNAGIPYDDFYDESKNRVEFNIVMVPFHINGYDARFPRDWGGDNSPFTAQDINSGAVAWIYDRESKTGINAGVSPVEFIDKIKIINKEK